MNRISPIRRERGITMVESLVALVVLSVGLLGIASLYVISMQSGRTAMLRTQAVNLVSDMADRIRANGLGGEAYASAEYSGEPEEHGCVVDENCTAAQLAEDDLARWIASVNAALPSPVTTVVFNEAGAAGNPDRYTISIDWREPGEEFRYETNLFLIPVTP